MPRDESLLCPRCGCNDVECIGRSTSWGEPGHDCHCRHCGRRFQVSEAVETEVIYAVAFAVQLCPYCHGGTTEVTSTRRKSGNPTVRYHRCADCLTRAQQSPDPIPYTFKSVERAA